MSKTTPVKPAQPFGLMHFGKDGSVKKVMDLLPNDKNSQELRVAQRFVSMVFSDVDPDLAIERLAEDDNDFLLHIPGRARPITLERIELVSRDYMTFLDPEDWYEDGGVKYHNVAITNDDDGTGQKTYNIDLERREQILVEKITKKLKYAKSDCSIACICAGLQ